MKEQFEERCEYSVYDTKEDIKYQVALKDSVIHIEIIYGERYCDRYVKLAHRKCQSARNKADRLEKERKEQADLLIKEVCEKYNLTSFSLKDNFKRELINNRNNGCIDYPLFDKVRLIIYKMYE